MIRAVLDTNIIVSAFFWGGLPLKALHLARHQQFRIVTTEVLITELTDVISRPKFAQRLGQIGETPESLLQEDFRALVEIVEPAKIDPVVVDDPDDDALIACALGGDARYIVSGDHHLLDIGQFQNIKILTISEFLTIVNE